jgi:hypothetical protein
MIAALVTAGRTRRARLLAPAMGFALLASACERPDHIEIDPRMPRLLHKGETVRLHGKLIDRQSHFYPTEHAAWSSRDPFIAAVDANGDVAALSSGHTVITARWEELSADVPVEVDLVESVKVSPDVVTVKLDGDSVKLTAAALGLDGRARSDREVHLTSANTAIARVDNEGQVCGVAVGQTTVHAKSDDKEAQIAVTVVKK